RHSHTPGPSRRCKFTSRLQPSAQAIKRRCATRNVMRPWPSNERKTNIKAKFAIYSLGVALMAIKAIEAQRAQRPAGEGKKPNIVFILMDNLGYGELGCYGGGILRGAATPRIDKLATEGAR